MDVYKDFRQFDSIEDLKEATFMGWDRCNLATLRKLFDSLPRRLADVIRNYMEAMKH